MRAAPLRVLLLLAALLAAGCARPDDAAAEEGWRVHEGARDAPREAYRGAPGAFDADVRAEGSNLTGAYHGPLPPPEAFLLAWSADAPFEARVEARAPQGDAWRGSEFVCSSQEARREWRDDVLVAVTEGDGTSCTARVTPLARLGAPGSGVALAWRLVPRALPERPLEPPPDPPGTLGMRFEARGLGAGAASAG